MIEFKPEINGNIIKYHSFEDSRQTGSVELVLDSPTHCTLNSIQAENTETAEGLIRSALTAAANRSSFACNYVTSAFSDVARALGFSDKGDVLYGEIPFLLSGCCGCKHNKMS